MTDHEWGWLRTPDPWRFAVRVSLKHLVTRRAFPVRVPCPACGDLVALTFQFTSFSNELVHCHDEAHGVRLTWPSANSFLGPNVYWVDLVHHGPTLEPCPAHWAKDLGALL